MILRLIFYKLKRLIFKQEIIGYIDNRFFVKPIKIKSSEFGKSTGIPAAIQIRIDNKKSLPPDVGMIADQMYFNNEPPLVFNVCFSCGYHNVFKKGIYTDPYSHWFNVFLGYYEISAGVEEWKRPFGYQYDGVSINNTDLLKIGKADWNVFSNYLYGVPQDSIKPFFSLEDKNCVKYIKREKIANKYWDVVEIENFKVVNGYLSPENDKKLLKNNKIFTPLWRLSFGKPCPRPFFLKSFFGSNMKAKFYMCHKKCYDYVLEKESFKTYLFGGTINLDFPDNVSKNINIIDYNRDYYVDFNNKFLEFQMEQAKNMIEDNYSNLGFDYE